MTTTSGARRRALVEDLGAAVRLLVRAAVDTEVDDEVLQACAASAREAAASLSAVVRPENELSWLDTDVDGTGGRPGEGLGYGPSRRTYSPITGLGNPLAPPVRILVADPVSRHVEAECMLHRVYEGPPTYGHGGMSAMLLDQILGTAVALTGSVGLTRSLEVDFRRPVPLGEPLRLLARVTVHEGTRVEALGDIVAAARPAVILAHGRGTFLLPRPEQLARMFGHLGMPADRIPSGD